MAQAIHKIDLHQHSCYQAEVAIEAALRRSWGVVILRLIHGYHGGTALRDFIWEHYQADPRIKKMVARSPGITDLLLKDL